MSSTSNNSLEEELQQLHRTLITDIHSLVDDTSKEGESFHFHLRESVGAGNYSRHESTANKIAALQIKKIFRVGEYEGLKTICKNSGNLDLIDIIENCEKEMKEVRHKYQQKVIEQDRINCVRTSGLKSESSVLATESCHFLTQTLQNQAFVGPSSDQQLKDLPTKRKSSVEPDRIIYVRTSELKSETSVIEPENGNVLMQMPQNQAIVRPSSDQQLTDLPTKRKSSGDFGQLPNKKGRYDMQASTSKEEPPAIEEKKFEYWTLAVKGLLIVRDVLAAFCYDKIKDQHQHLLSEVQKSYSIITVACNLCKLDTLKPYHTCTDKRKCPLKYEGCNCLKSKKTVACPNKVCGAIYDEIIKLGTWSSTNRLSLNSDIGKWTTDPWSIALCFTYGGHMYSDCSVDDMDLSSLLQIIFNCKSFSKDISSEHFLKVRDIRNELFHNPRMKSNSSELNVYIKIMLELVNLPELKTRQGTQKAINELNKIANGNETVIANGNETVIANGNETVYCHADLVATRRELLMQGELETQTKISHSELSSHQRRRSPIIEEMYSNLSDKFVPEELNSDPFKRQVYEESITMNETEEEVRVMILGSSSKEKTLFVRRLLGQSFKNVMPTDGIDVHNCVVKSNGKWEVNTNKACTDNGFEVWDVGANFVNYATHQVFLSTCAIYIIVLDLKNGLDVLADCNCHFGKHCTSTIADNISFWVNSIHTFVGSKDGKSPPIILVGMSDDKHPQDTTKTFDAIMSLFSDSHAVNHIHKKLICATHLDELRSLITDLRSKQVKRIPSNWKELSNEIKSLSENIPIISLNELQDVASVQRDREGMACNELKVFLKYQHELGRLCYFDVPKLSNNVILNPMVIVDAFKDLTIENNCCREYPINQKWKELQEKGIAHRDIVDMAWSTYTYDTNLLLEYLKEYHIIADIKSTSSKDSQHYLIPSFLNSSVKDDTKNAFLEGKTTSEVSLRYENIPKKVLPILYNKILAAMISKWRLCNFKNKYLIFDNFAVCKPNFDHAVVLFIVESGIELMTVHLKRGDVSSKVCDVYRRFVENTIKEHVHGLRFKTNKEIIEHFISYRCRHFFHENKGSVSTLPIKTLSCDTICPDHVNHVIKPEYIRKWYPVYESNKPATSQTRKLTEEEYSKLAQSVDGNVQKLSEGLGISKKSFRQIKGNYISQDEHVYHLLLAWDRHVKEEATLENLVEILKEIEEIDDIEVDWDEIKNMQEDASNTSGSQ